MVKETKIFNGVLLEEEVVFTLDDLSRACSVETETITLLVEEGIIEPVADDADHWHFSGMSLQRVRTAIRLQNDLGVNLPGAALALDLLDEIAALRAQLEAMGKNLRNK